MLKEPEDSHAASEERDVPQVCKCNSQRTVRAEDPNRWKRTENTHPKADHVRQRCDCD